ncbi:hypothetical protein ACP70R_030242 [Stipagrostis hirtigluma subsp. patula]
MRREMGFHLLAIAAARGLLQAFHLSAPLLWPLNLCLPSARRLPEACAALADHAARLRAAWSRRRRARWGGPDGYLLHAVLAVPD